MNIFVSGSLAYDRIMNFPGRFSDHILPDKIHILNVCFTVNGMAEKFGGTAGNIAYSLRLLEERPAILATIGKDHHNYIKRLKELDLTLEGIKVIENEFTAGAYITTDLSDNQITGFNPGAMQYKSEYSFGDSVSADSIAIMSPGNLEDMKEYARQYKKLGIRCICDPGQSLTAWDAESLKEWISGSTMLITNDYELELIMKILTMNKEDLLTITKTVITTLGEKGSVVADSAGETLIPAAKITQVVDPTGAGDAYRAGLIKGLCLARSVIDSARIASVAAVYAVEHYGTQEHSYTFDEFRQRYTGNFGAF
ncbi:MAG: carbohydrate kinase family protein [Dissulfurispiraceae bacterium]|jgi:adenosine kinase|nr:carbohydrate kinase family protein [Dissulfurispiraceae bacterium]